MKMTDVDYLIAPVLLSKKQAYDELEACRMRHEEMVDYMKKVTYEADWASETRRVMTLIDANLGCFEQISELLIEKHQEEEEEIQNDD